MDQVNLRSEFSEENCLLARSIAPTYYADRDIPIERAVASSARSQTVAFHRFLVRYPEPFGGRTTGHNHAFCFQPFTVDLQTMIIRARLEFVDFSVLEASAQFLGFPVHVHNELRTIDALRQPGKVLDLPSCP